MRSVICPRPPTFPRSTFHHAAASLRVAVAVDPDGGEVIFSSPRRHGGGNPPHYSHSYRGSAAWRRGEAYLTERSCGYQIARTAANHAALIALPLIRPHLRCLFALRPTGQGRLTPDRIGSVCLEVGLGQ